MHNLLIRQSFKYTQTGCTNPGRGGH